MKFHWAKCQVSVHSTDKEIVYSPHKYRETEGTKDDGDIVLTTNNEYFIKGSHKNHNIITYEKGIATPAKMTVNNITKTVMKGFGTGVGGFSNTATILYAMAAIFNKPGHEDQYNTIMTRIKLLREIVGQEIDRIKGADKPSLPSSWKKYQTIDPNDSQEEKTRKMRENATVISKKPYFFRYLYPELNQKFKQFEASYNQISRDMFGVKFKKLLKKEDQTEEEKMLVRRYQKYSPLITSDCTMNRLCREFESIDFDIKFAKDVQTGNKKYKVSMLPTFEKWYKDSFDPIKLALVKKMYTEYCNKKQLKRLSDIYNSCDIDEDYFEIRSNIYTSIIDELQEELVNNKMCGEEFLFYCHKLSESTKSFNWGFAWEVVGDKIIDIIPPGQTFAPVKDNENGEYEYLGNKYYLKDVSNALSLFTDKMVELLLDPNNYEDDDDEDEQLSSKTQSEIKEIILQGGQD